MAHFSRYNTPAFYLTPLAAGLALAMSSTALHAQTTAEAPRELRNIVVTAAGFEQDLSQAPASMSVLTREDLQSRRYNNLAEALQGVEGIDVRGGTGKTGGLDISIRGMPSDYTLILIDGRRQNTSGDVAPNGFGEFATSFMPPLSAIERIEIIRGPASTLYGSDAMGGVINIITRPVSDEWGGTLSVDTTFPEDSEFGGTSNVSVFATGPLVENLLGLQVRASHMNRAASNLTPSEANAPDFNTRGQTPVQGRTSNIGGRLTLTPNAQHQVYLDLDLGRQWYDNGTPSNRLLSNNDTPTNWRGYADDLRFERTQWVLGHRSDLGFGQLESSIQHQVTETTGRTIPGNPQNPTNTGIPGKNVGDARELENTNLIVDTRLVLPWQQHRFTIGAQYWDAEFVDGVAPVTMEQTTYALFVEDEWYLRDNLALTLGGRYDHHDEFGGHFSPRAYLVYNVNDQLTLRSGVAQAYKAPRVDQIQEGLTGITAQGATATIGSPDLDPETSTSYEIGAHWENYAGVRASATFFYNDIEDKIASGPAVPNCDFATNPNQPGCVSIGGFPGQAEFGQSINIDEATTQGVELSTTLPLGAFFAQAEGWTLSANYTYTDSELKSRDGRRNQELADTPEHLFNARLSWAVNDQLTTWLSTEYRGESRRFNEHPDDLTGNNARIYAAVGDISAYNLWNLGATYQIAENVRLNAAVYNLFDLDFRGGWKAYEDTNGDTQYAHEYSHQTRSTRGGVQEGRRYWISATYDF